MVYRIHIRIGSDFSGYLSTRKITIYTNMKTYKVTKTETEQKTDINRLTYI